MAKVTSKYQVTLPKALADQYGIRPGDDIAWVAAGEIIRVIPPGKQGAPEDTQSRLRVFDQATDRLAKRARGRRKHRFKDKKRGWTREDIYTRGRAR